MYDLALEMIDAYLAPEPMAYLANEYGYGVANQNALSLVKPDIIKLLSLDDPGDDRPDDFLQIYHRRTAPVVDQHLV